MQEFKEYRREGRKPWTGRGKPQQSGKKGHPQFVSVWVLSEGYESYRDASTGSFRQGMDLVYMWIYSDLFHFKGMRFSKK